VPEDGYGDRISAELVVLVMVLVPAVAVEWWLE